MMHYGMSGKLGICEPKLQTHFPPPHQFGDLQQKSRSIVFKMQT
jgi:hypothetical protein